MSNFRQCPDCRAWVYGKHVCPPRWRVWCPEDGEDRESTRIALRKKEQGMDWIYVNRTLRDQHERVLLHIKIATNMLKKLRAELGKPREEEVSALLQR